MIEFHTWCATQPHLLAKPWIILGKGPTFARRDEFDLSGFHRLSLNHVVRELPVTLAHLIDIDVARDCADRLLDNAQFVVAPRHPHVEFRPTAARLEDFFADIPVLGELSRRNRLLWYNLGNWQPEEEAPVIDAKYFSSEAAFGLLAAMGVKSVASLGIDGGRHYSHQFHDLDTCLANQQPSFSVQFIRIEQILKRHAMSHNPLVSEEPMRIFVGSDDSQHVAAKVLEFTIRKFASRPVAFHAMRDLPCPTPKDPANQPKTGFSFYRFHIPRLCGFEGRGLYLDADMQVFADIAELFAMPWGEADVLCTFQRETPEKWKDNPAFSSGRQLSVMMLNASKLRWDIDEIVRGLDDGRYTYKELMGQLAIVPPDRIADSLPPEWNHLEHFEEGKTRLLHYTVVPTQPWKTDENPLGHLWMAAFKEAVESGFITWPDVRPGIEHGFLKPGLAEFFPEGRAIRFGTAASAPQQVVKLKDEVARHKAENAELKAKIKSLRGEVERLRRTATWKVGRLVTLGLGGK